MAEKKIWKGIQQNSCMFQGTITEDPVYNGDYAFLTLSTSVVQRDANGQIVELDQEVPLMVEPGGPVAVVKNYIKTGRKLLATCQYKRWLSDGAVHHAFVVRKFDLGDKPYEDQAGKGAPPIPR